MTTLENKIHLAKAKINDLLSTENKPLIGFSGGKESVVLAHLAKAYKAEIELVWVNTQAMFPHMIEFVRGYKDKGYKLVELLSDQPTRIIESGLPTNVVPIHFLVNKPPKGHKITDYLRCCLELRNDPMYEYMISNGKYTVIVGQRKDDSEILGDCGSTPFDFKQFTLSKVSPLWEWSEAEVMEYIKLHQLELPKQYPEVMDSLECWSCTHNPKIEKLDFMRREYPELLEILKPMLSYVHASTINELEKYTKVAEYANQ